MVQIIALLVGIASLICFIYVLIKQFQIGGAVHGIIGIVTCGIWTFIWGWINASKANIRNVMLAWTALIILGIILNVVGGGFYYSYGTPEMG